MGARSATEVGVRRYAIGLDLGAPLLEVARRGFSSTFSNQMGQLGGWISSPAADATWVDPHHAPFTPVLHLADDLAGTLAAREAGSDEVVRVGLAVPSWLGWCDRHHIARQIDPRDVCQLVWASTPLVAAFGTNMAGTTPLGPELVVAIDLDLGVSASLVSIDRTGVREMVSASSPPRWSNRSDSVAAVVADLAALARDIGMSGVNRMVLVAEGAGSNTAVEQTIRTLDQAWGECLVDIVRSRAEIARAAVLLADMDSFEVVGAAPRGVGVLLDDERTGRSSIHVIVPRNAPIPSRTTATFDLGPDDGAEIYLDVYEEQPDEPGISARSVERRGHRLVMTARLDRRGTTAGGRIDAQDPDLHAQVGDDVEVSFVVGVDGMLHIESLHHQPGASAAWACTWAPSRLVTASSPMRRSDAGLDGAMPNGTVVAPLAVKPSASVRRVAREMAPPLGLPEALGRAERIVSREVGRPVAIRSAMALFGCGDRDDSAVLHDRADRLERALHLCAGNDAARAVFVAVEVARRAIEAPHGRVYAGGSSREVANEVERVVEHLAVVIGAITPAERNRLVRDAELLGFDHERSRALVDQLIDDAKVDSDGRPDELRDPTATVVVSADGFRLAPADVRLDHDQAAIMVLLFEP